MFYKEKDCGLSMNVQLKDLDEASGTVQIYVSAFNNKDSDGDIIIKGAYAKTIQEKGPSGSGRIKHLKQHDVNLLVGRPSSMEETATGLLVTSHVSKSTDGKNLMADYKLDLYEHSVGFVTVKDEFSKEDNANMIKEINLWEYSSVTWGSNPNTPLVGMKSILKMDNPIDEINKRMSRIANALVKGEHTDERLELYQIELKQIQSLYNDLISNQPPSTDPLNVDKAVEYFKSTFNKPINN